MCKRHLLRVSRKREGEYFSPLIRCPVAGRRIENKHGLVGSFCCSLLHDIIFSLNCFLCWDAGRIRGLRCEVPGDLAAGIWWFSYLQLPILLHPIHSPKNTKSSFPMGAFLIPSPILCTYVHASLAQIPLMGVSHSGGGASEKGQKTKKK